MIVPDNVFKIRIGPDWHDATTDDYFKDKKVVVVSLPGAFTPVCSSKQLPAYEKMYDQFIELGCTNVYCMSVNDSFVMNAWAESLGIEKVEMIPDGNGVIAEALGMLVKKENLGFGNRSWRYAAYIDDGEIKLMLEEPNKENNYDLDPYEVSDPATMYKELKKLLS